MHIGIVYDLKDDYLAEGFSEEDAAEFDKPDTIEGIEAALRQLGHTTNRVGHFKKLVSRLAAGDRWDFVFNIAEGVSGLGREAQVPAALVAYGIPFTFSDPLAMCLCLHKGITKQLVRAAGIPTADFVVVNTHADVDVVRLPYPLFAKPVAEGTGKGINARSRVETPQALHETCGRLLERFHQPVLVETYLPGREFTVGIVGSGAAAEAMGVMEVLYQAPDAGDIYSHHTKTHYEDLVRYQLEVGDLGRQCTATALKAWRALACLDAGRVDLRCDAVGVPNFIEVNPLAGLNPIHSDLPILCRLNGVGFDELIARIMRSALKRYGMA